MVFELFFYCVTVQTTNSQINFVSTSQKNRPPPPLAQGLDPPLHETEIPNNFNTKYSHSTRSKIYRIWKSSAERKKLEMETETLRAVKGPVVNVLSERLIL